MSVLIKGMEMPDKCGHCRFATAFECEVTKNFITTFNVRQVDCPLAPVPPHKGALVDRAALWVEICKICDRRDAGLITDLTCLQQILSTLRHATTVIPAEEGET